MRVRAQHRAARMASRSAPCSLHRKSAFTLSGWDIVLPVTSSSMTGLAVGLWWSLKGRTDLHVRANSTLTAVREQDEILRAIVRPYAAAVGPRFLLVQDYARLHVARFCRQFLDDECIDAIDWPSHTPDLSQIEQPWNVMYRCIQHCQVHPQTVPDPGLGIFLMSQLIVSWKIFYQTLSGVLTGARGPHTSLSHF